MSEENVEIVRRMFDAWNRGNYEDGQKTIDADVEVEVDLGFDVDGKYLGHAGLAELLEFWNAFGSFRSDVEELIPSGEDVFTTVLHHGMGKSSGIKVEMRNWQVFTLRGGKIVRYRLLGTRVKALKAAGLSE